MAELKNMTVQALRDLARKALGRGHSRLKTKSELVAALQSAGRNVSDAAEKAAARVKEVTGRAAKATGRAAKAAEKVVASTKAKAATRKSAREKVKAAKTQAAKTPAAKAQAAKAPARGRAAAKPPRAAAVAPPAPEALPPPDRRDEPDAEGYFVARVRGEDALRDAPHPMTEGALEEDRAAEPPRKGLRREHHFEEDLGELPWTYEDDALVALPRDPRTLYVYWDHRGDTLSGAFVGLDEAKAQIWVLARTADGGWERVRTVELALESRSWFVHDLDPGRVYRAEIHLVDRRGQTRRLQDPSNEMRLPPFGPSPIVDDRFMRIPWSEPLTRLLRHVREGAPFPEELRAILASLSDWSRFVSPTWGGSASGAGVGGGAGGPGGRPTGPSGAPSSPSSPFGPFGWGSGSGEGR